MAPAEIVLGCVDLDAALARFVEDDGWRLDTVFPADDPAQMVLSHGPQRMRLVRDDALPAEPIPGESPEAPPASLDQPVVSRLADSSDFGLGRAGMSYRDLIPDRLGGALIASHIRVSEEGPVDDYVHYHHIVFQLIYCRRGWVEVVYEDQGEPFVLRPGDAVLQPPGIRHRVLRASAGLEVVELASPAVHATHRDHDLVLPTAAVVADRDFGGQKFVHHVASEATVEASWMAGYDSRSLGLTKATGGVVNARVHTPLENESAIVEHDAEWMFFFVLDGDAELEIDGVSDRLIGGDSIAVPADLPFCWRPGGADLALLEVSMPAASR